MILKRFFSVTFFLLVLGGLTFAQNQQYKFSQLDVNKGLSDSRVKCFLKDQKGFVWIGTFSGLNRFDGYSLKVFKNELRDTTSLVQNDILDLFEDPLGKIWVTLYSAQNIYDPVTETFHRNTNPALDNFGLPHGKINKILKGDKNRYWFSHATSGLYRYANDSKEIINIKHNPADTSSISPHNYDITFLAEDKNDGLWIAYRNGIFEKLDIKTNKITYRNSLLKKMYPSLPSTYCLLIDADGDIWIYANDNKGVFYLNKDLKSLVRINKTSAPIRLNENIVRGIAQDDQGLIWVATDHGGINIIDKKKKTVHYVFNDEEDEKSVGENSINTLFKDRDGFIWAGTFKKGVSYYHQNLFRFDLYQHQLLNPASLPYNDINAFAEDDNGNLWIGTNGQGLIYFNRKNQTFKSFKHDPKNANSLSGDVIVSLFIDKDKKLWVGTYYDGLNCYDGKRFTHYRHSQSNKQSLADDNVWEIYEDSQRRLWIGTLGSGVDLFDRVNQKFIHHNYDVPNSVHTSYITTVLEDNEGTVWFGTGYGLDALPKGATSFTHYFNDVNNPKSLSHDNVFSLLEDSRGNLWIGTSGGLNLFNRKTGTFEAFTTEQGLPHNSILTIQEDSNGNLWMGTSNGISNLILSRGAGKEILSYQFRNFSDSDGLQGKHFNEGAALKTRGGEMVFAGSNGFNLFNPNTIQVNKAKPDVWFSDFQILNKTVKVGEEVDGRVVLQEALNFTKEITLSHNSNVFSLEFAALNFFSPEKSHYKYMLKGFNRDWLFTTASARKVIYTNLDPGDYTFVVQASNNDGVWSDGLELKITVLPPFWKSTIAFFIYVVLIICILLFSRQIVLQRERMRYNLEKERREALQVHELDLMKIKFFTNVSHEFRTPLSLIITPLEKMLKQTTSEEHKVQFQMIYRNARRLLNMVNQLLDFRKMEVQEVTLNLSGGDIIDFIKETANSFSDLSEKKSITFSITSNTDHLEAFFDNDKLEKILFNLLSNAFKFTPEFGKVGITINVLTKFDSIEKWLEIKVSDTGIGIPIEKHEKIFERFFQNDLPTSMVNQGSGIGLSITKEFVKAHKGTIVVESEPDKGSSFIVSIPVAVIPTIPSVAPNVSREETPVEQEKVVKEEDAVDPVKSTNQVLLLVEDNEDFRFYLKDNLKSHYTILEARNGKEGYDIARHQLPDLIVSDVMMPEMSGIELCKKIKTEKTTSHIPVILLTARAAEEQKIEGFETGADDYINKPFSFEILQSRIKNLILQRAQFHKAFRKQIEVKPSEINITSLDEILIQKAIKLVEDNMSNVDFSVETLSSELNISRVQLYKKLLSLTGKAPLEFIRTIRIQRSAQLLEKSQLTVSQVAYQVGFNNPKYFTKYFKEEYNVLPSVYAANAKTKNSQEK